jgi:DNA-binding beta-propeller fold protein YncE
VFDRVYQYPLDTAWDISSITSGSSGNLFVRSNGGDPRDIKFNTNGTKLFVLDRVVSRVYEWSLSTPWDVTTGSYTTGDYFEVNDQEPASNGLAFSPDGTNMFVVGSNADTVFQYSLTTGFDITTAAYTGKSFSVSEDTKPEGLEFS